MEYCEKWGKDIDEAVELALKDLKLTKDEVDVIVLEEPSKGFLGIGSKLAKVRVEKKGTEKPQESEERSEEPAFDYGVKDLRSKPKENTEAGAEDKQRKPRKDRGRKDHGDRKRRNDTFEIPENVASVIAFRPEDLKPVDESPAIDFLNDLTRTMGLEFSVTAEGNEDTLYLNLDGKDAGAVIGKRGHTLDAIQYLTSLVVNKEHGNYVRVVVDAENYRSKREKTLQQLAMRLASKVERSGRPVKLEPMNPYERMVIHATLHYHDKVTTRSEGDEPYRRVIIEMK